MSADRSFRVIRVTLEDFNDKLNKELETPDNKVFVLFFGTEVSATNESWCPDCVIADPKIRAAVGKVPNSVLIEAPVGLREEWKGNKEHPYRVDFKISAIPTLCKWKSTGQGASLVEEDCADDAKLEEFLKD